jgi:sigma-B regulation protein RsbU (phosphoserine phosphatase)
LTDGIALGVAEGILFEQQMVQLEPGDCLVIYTDGVTEAFNPDNEEFTEARLQPLFAAHAASDVQDAVHHVIRAVDGFAAGAPQSDDITCVALLYRPGAGPEQGPASKVEIS